MNLKKYLKAPAMREGEQILTVVRASEVVADSGTHLIQLALRNREGASFLHHFSLTPKGLPYLAGFCAACGLSDEQLEDFDPADLLGRQVVGNVVLNTAGYYVMDAWFASHERDEVRDKSESGGAPMNLEELF